MSSAFTLQEVLIAIVIVALLLGFSAPFIINYRGKSGVNTAVEITKAIMDRASEEAKTAGYPLPDALKNDGLTDSATQLNGDSQLLIRLKKRLTSGEQPQVLSQKVLRVPKASFQQIGRIDLSTETSVNGIFVELAAQPNGGTEVLLATIPVDVNGEFVLLGNAGDGEMTFSYGEYSRTISLTIRGTSRLDRR